MNPMDPYNKGTNPAQVAAMQQLMVLLGGLGKGPAAAPLVPGAAAAPQPQPASQQPILGGIGYAG